MLHRYLALAGLLLLLCAAPAVAAPVTVNLRVEGTNATVFEGSVTTDAKTVTTAAGGSHKCDGTNGGTSNTAGGTPTTALDDASKTAGFTWDGSYSSSFDDFLIERIASDGGVGAPFTGSFWNLIVNRAGAAAGGCQIRVNTGDQVLLEWQDGTKPNLQLTAPASAQAGQPVDVTVQQYASNGVLAPAVGASVGGATSGADGHASVTFGSAGVQHVKAARADAIRSNAVDVCVYAPGSGACGSAVKGPPPTPTLGPDKVKPTVAFRGLSDGAKYKRGPRQLLGSANDDRGLFQVYFRLKRHSHQGCSWFSQKSARFTRSKAHCSARYQRVGNSTLWSYLLPSRLPVGKYELDEKAIDSSYNATHKTIKFEVTG
jgi:hypothetical protein